MPTPADRLRRNLTLAALATVAGLLVVIAPFLLVREAQRESMAAAAAVNHSHEVESTAHALMYALRNRESAALAHAFDHDSPLIRARLDESRRSIPTLLAQLTALTRDNPDQQVEVGRLAAQAEQRGIIIDEILALAPGAATRAQVDQLLVRNPLRQVANRVIAAERALLKARVAEAAWLAERSRRVTWAAMAAQILLLAVAGWLLARLMTSRRVAEAEAMRSSARAQSVLFALCVFTGHL